MWFYQSGLILYDTFLEEYIRLSYYDDDGDWWAYARWCKGAWGPANNSMWVSRMQEQTRRVSRLEALIVLGEKIGKS